MTAISSWDNGRSEVVAYGDIPRSRYNAYSSYKFELRETMREWHTRQGSNEGLTFILLEIEMMSHGKARFNM
jgi:hypothetical protein